MFDGAEWACNVSASIFSLGLLGHVPGFSTLRSGIATHSAGEVFGSEGFSGKLY